tara:strand:+ start:9583 stop:9777 length:195 start_codon:yes stop_codon:yes gene_type:complete
MKEVGTYWKEKEIYGCVYKIMIINDNNTAAMLKFWDGSSGWISLDQCKNDVQITEDEFLIQSIK